MFFCPVVHFFGRNSRGAEPDSAILFQCFIFNSVPVDISLFSPFQLLCCSSCSPPLPLKKFTSVNMPYFRTEMRKSGHLFLSGSHIQLHIISVCQLAPTTVAKTRIDMFVGFENNPFFIGHPVHNTAVQMNEWLRGGWWMAGPSLKRELHALVPGGLSG